MEIFVGENGVMTLEKVFNPIRLLTPNNEELIVVMRDGGYEITYTTQKTTVRGIELKGGKVIDGSQRKLSLNHRVSPDVIKELKDNEIFVFGSNLAGKHGAGAARKALEWGAVYGNPEGMQGATYAIPTKDMFIRETLPIEHIKRYVDRFIIFAKIHSNLKFLVTEIGCGLARRKPEDIAPLFIDAINLPNVYLPKRFVDILINLETEKNES